MTTRNTESRHDAARGPARRGRGDEGAALLEFALVSTLLFTLLFGIISFGLILSFRQDLTRAAAEGARAGAVAYPSSGAQASAVSATNTAVNGFGKTCGSGGMTCTIPAVASCTGSGTAMCVTVSLSYDNKAFPLIAPLPIISSLLPTTLTAKSVAQVNP